MSNATAGRGRVAGLLFVLVWLSCAWFGSWEWNTNTAVRMYAALAMVEDGTARIDRYAGLSLDKAMFDDHYYSDKAPGMTLMALPAVAFADAATGQRARDLSLSPYDAASDRFMRLRVRIAAATTAGLLTAIAATALFLLTTSLGGSLGAGVFAALGFALGTPVWGCSATRPSPPCLRSRSGRHGAEPREANRRAATPHCWARRSAGRW